MNFGLNHSIVPHLVMAFVAFALTARAAETQASAAHIVKGSDRLRADDLLAAESELRAAISLGTRDAHAYNLLGIICDRTNRLDEAVHYYAEALRIDPGYVAALNDLGSALIRQGKLDEALKLFESSVRARPSDVTGNFNIGVIQAQQGRFTEAAQFLERAHLAAPDDAVVVLWQAKLQVELHLVADAVGSLGTVLNSLKQNSSGRISKAGLISEALRVSARLHELGPPSDKTTFLLAQFQFLAKDYLHALESLKSIDESNRGVEFWNLQGMSSAGSNQFPEAVAALSKAIAMEPKRPDLLFNLGGVFQAAGDNESAIRLFKRAIASGDARAEAEFALALSYFNFGSYDDAIASCRSAIRSNPNFDQAYLLTGRAYARMKKTNEAIVALRKAASIHPGCEQCDLHLALVLLDKGDESEALRLLREAIRLNPANASAHYQLGKTLAQRKENSEAVAELEKAVELDPSQDRACYQLGRLYLTLGDKARSQMYFDKVRDLKEKRLAVSQEHLSQRK